MFPFDAIHIFSVTTSLAFVVTFIFCVRTRRQQKKDITSITDLLNAIPDAILICDNHGRIIKANDQSADLLGYTNKEIIGMPVEELMPARFREHHVKLRDSFFAEPKARPMGQGRELVVLTKDGNEIPVEIALGHTTNGDTRVLIVLRDITLRREDEQTIYQLAYYDTLTGLPNRLHFNEHVKKVIERAREQKWRFAFFLVDLDDFKRINDTLGHYAGDELLKEIAVRLQHVIELRCEDENECQCFAARLGGDEFVLIIERLRDARQAEDVAELIFSQFDTPVIVEDQEIYVKLSVGIGLYPHDGSSPSSLLKSADLALYTAKEKGKNQFHFHEASMNAQVVEYFQYESALRYFIDTNDFEVHYQPIVSVKDGSICGAEALFRGNRLKYSNLRLDRTITIAEDSGMIVSLGRNILRRACEDCVECIRGGYNAVISVNISIRELNEPDFIENLSRTLEETGLPPSNLAIEVTESLFMVNYNENIRKLKKLKEMGIFLSIDDFGKGYSSMSYLRRLPADKLKIDKEFIDHIAVDVKSEEIVRGITMMAQTLGMVVCAEGVETDEQFKVLREVGVDQVQGYLTGRPVPANELINMMKE